jgi:TonB family protein
MSLNQEEAQKNLRESEVDLDNLLTNFLDQEIGIPPEKGELAPDLDRKLKETLREIGMVNAESGAGLTTRETPSPPSRADLPVATFGGEGFVAEDRPSVPESVGSLLPAVEKPKVEPARNATGSPDFIVQEALQPEKLATRYRIPILAAAVAGLLALLGISGYVWLTPRSSEKQHESTTTTQPETALGGQSAVPNLSATGPEATPVPSSQDTTQKTESGRPPASNQDQVGKRASAPQAAVSPASSSNMEPNPIPDSRTLRVRTGDNLSPTPVPVSPLPPAAPKALIPDLPSPEGNASIALKDLALPKSSLAPASQPQVALPTAMPAEQVRTANVTPAVALSKIQVVYPELAKRTGTKGSVEVEFSLDENGKVTTAKAMSGPIVLRKAAEAAVYKARFKPATSNGTNVPANGKITLVFNLETH